MILLKQDRQLMPEEIAAFKVALENLDSNEKFVLLPVGVSFNVEIKDVCNACPLEAGPFKILDKSLPAEVYSND